MILAMTMMIRDEADIVEAMIEHHLSQGVDMILATDNGSIDGTLNVLKSYASKGVLDLREDPVHNKQQRRVVTAMARDAYLKYHADWVINADADEFWLPVDRSRTLKSVFEDMPKELQSFTVPVIDMIGAPALRGSGLSRLVYRDSRPEETLKNVGLLAHSTHDAAQIGSADVEVAQGNHYVSLESKGQPSAELAIEVLHLPWRSWEQYRGKVEKAGKAYERSGLTPSPNHHGMRDYRRLQSDTLFAFYIARHPDETELTEALNTGVLTRDDFLTRYRGPVADVPLDTALELATRRTSRALINTQTRLEAAETEKAAMLVAFETLEQEKEELLRTQNELRERGNALQSQLDVLANRRAIRLVDGIARGARRLLNRHR